MTALAEQRVAIRRVRIRSPGGDALRVRLGVDRVLGAADLRPRGLPPAAILVVRSLADPLPGRLDTTAAFAAPDWQRAVGDALDRCLRGAARPGAGGAVGNAPAVLFADRSELLACLARDWSEGAPLERWWWPALGIFGPPDIVAAFAETPEAVPAAIERLAPTPALVAFASRLPRAAAASLARAVALVFGAGAAADAALAEIEPARARVRGAVVRGELPPTSRAQEEPASPGQARAGGRAAVAPWRTLAPASVSALAPEQEAFVGLALALRVEPAKVRSAPFVTAVRAWRAALADREPRQEPAVVGTSPAPAAHARSLAMSRRDRPEPEPARGQQRFRPGASPDSPRRPAMGKARDLEPSAVDTETEPIHFVGAPATDILEPTPTPAMEPETAVATQLGGLFHLVLVGQALGLYGDFTTPAEPGIRVDVWDFVTLLGRRLLRRPLRDPVWALLADLAGREPGARPGRGFRPPRRRTLPRSWRRPFEAAGIELERELARHRQATGTSALDRWLDELAAYVRARLALALGVSAGRAVRLTLRRPARVLVSPTRVDVVSRLADLPIEVRLAGVDRDPGYVPAAGRSLYFHFE